MRHVLCVCVYQDPGLTVCRSILEHESLVAHHHEGCSIDTSSNCRGLLSSVVLRCGWCCALIQFVDFLVQVSHVLDAKSCGQNTVKGVR